MPYINQEQRKELDQQVDRLIHSILMCEGFPRTQEYGRTNYVMFRLLKGLLPPDYSYVDLNNVVGVVESCKQEFYRRVVVPYEEKKREENGDV